MVSLSISGATVWARFWGAGEMVAGSAITMGFSTGVLSFMVIGWDVRSPLEFSVGEAGYAVLGFMNFL